MEHSDLILHPNNATIMAYMLTYGIYIFRKHVKCDKTASRNRFAKWIFTVVR